MPAECSGRTEAPYLSSVLLVVKDMEQSRGDHGIELLARGTQVEGIAHEKPDGEATITGLDSGDGDRHWGRIDAGGLETPFRREQSMLARATTHIQDTPLQRRSLGELGEVRLRRSNVPRRRPLVGGIEIKTRRILLAGQCARQGVSSIPVGHCELLPCRPRNLARASRQRSVKTNLESEAVRGETTFGRVNLQKSRFRAWMTISAPTPGRHSSGSAPSDLRLLPLGNARRKPW